MGGDGPLVDRVDIVDLDDETAPRGLHRCSEFAEAKGRSRARTSLRQPSTVNEA